MGTTVAFKRVQVREYPICLGENPSVEEGPPIAMDWMYHPWPDMTLEEWESLKITRPCKKSLCLSPNVRIKRLKKAGYKLNDIMQAANEAQSIRESRLESSMEDLDLEKAGIHVL